jgi:hypothetical protein
VAVVKLFCEPALQSDKLAIPEANSVAHDMKNYSVLNADEDAVLCPHTGSPICPCCEDQYLVQTRSPAYDARVSSVGREAVWGFQGQAETQDSGHRCS